MKKELKDITIGELFKECCSRKTCSGCPMEWRDCPIDEMPEEDLEKEYEVEEDD